jgi:hypothetical protein
MPKTRPTPPAAAIDSTTAQIGTAVGMSTRIWIRSASPVPMATPSAPPMLVSITASTRNWARMRRRRAPSARRTPISLVRSVTETSMMFMTPMPPIRSAMPQMPTEALAMVPVSRSKVSCIEALENISKSLSASGATPRARRRIVVTSSWVRPILSGSRACTVTFSECLLP